MTHIKYVPILDDYYQGQGFPPYRWSVHETSPWSPLKKPLKECRVALLSSGGISRKDQPPFDALSVNDLTFREIPKHTHAQDLVINDDYYGHSDADKDINCVFPIDRFRELEEEGYIGSMAPTAYGLGMGRMYKRTALQNEMVPQIIKKLQDEKVDVLFLVSVWPLDHQSVGLIARVVEEAGLPTIVVGSARDIMEQVKAPRSVFINFPLGRQIGKPSDTGLQMSIIKDALDTFKDIREPGTILDLPYQWGTDFGYKPGSSRRQTSS